MTTYKVRTKLMMKYMNLNCAAALIVLLFASCASQNHRNNLKEGHENEKTEGLTKDQVGSTIYQHMDDIKRCYHEAKLINAKINGKIIVDFIIDKAGSVKKTSID